jgi:hypothetical protein
MNEDLRKSREAYVQRLRAMGIEAAPFPKEIGRQNLHNKLGSFSPKPGLEIDTIVSSGESHYHSRRREEEREEREAEARKPYEDAVRSQMATASFLSGCAGALF